MSATPQGQPVEALMLYAQPGVDNCIGVQLSRHCLYWYG